MDLALSLERFLTVYLLGSWQGRGNDRGRSVPILMYHGIADNPGESGLNRRLFTRPDLFAAQIEYLAGLGYEAVGLDLVWAYLEDDKAPVRRLVALTFDDGFSDILGYVMPLLERFGFAATVFLPTAFIACQRRAFKGRSCLTWREVAVLQGRGVRFGSHTVSHPHLNALPLAAVRDELLHSREEIEQRLGVAVPDFSCPYAFPDGDRVFVARFRDILEQCGYRNGVTTRIGVSRTGDDRLLARRIPVNSGDDMLMYSHKLGGSYDWLGRFQRVAKILRAGPSLGWRGEGGGHAG